MIVSDSLNLPLSNNNLTIGPDNTKVPTHIGIININIIFNVFFIDILKALVSSAADVFAIIGYTTDNIDTTNIDDTNPYNLFA